MPPAAIRRVASARRILALGLALASCVGCAYQAHQAGERDGFGRETGRAYAEFAGNGITGRATLVEVENGRGRAVHVVVTVRGDPRVLAPGLHGLHIHEVGECVPPFLSAGGHFDPGPSGNADPDANHPFHMGDLPNVLVNARGEGQLDAWTTRVTLSPGPLSLFDADGSALILHQNPDRGVTGPTRSGVSGGPRLACAVIHQ